MDKHLTVRSICLFTDAPDQNSVQRLNSIAQSLINVGVGVQTKRILSPQPMRNFNFLANEHDLYLSAGLQSLPELESQIDTFLSIEKLSCHIDLTDELPDTRHADLFFRLASEAPHKTFYFCYSFNIPPSSPFFPSATYSTNGFSVGLQATDLTVGCHDTESWFSRMSEAWNSLIQILGDEQDFLGIDSSPAPLGYGNSSLINFAKQICGSFQRSLLTDFYVRLTRFLQEMNPKPVGLCGLMLPCLEDFLLAEEYEVGRFDLTTNLYLSLHSGLGVDTYPLGLDESPARLIEILRLVRALSIKYNKPLSVRFVSDGKALIGDRTDFRNSYLKDVVVRPLEPMPRPHLS